MALINWQTHGRIDFERKRWGFQISPALSWFESLAGNLNLDVTIITNSSDGLSDQYIWTSAHLNDLEEPGTVKDRASALKALFDGALLVGHGTAFDTFDLGDLYELHTDAIQPPTIGNVLVSPFSDKYIITKVPAHLNPLSHFVGRAIFLSRYDPVSRGILSFLGVNGITWISLYAALDELKYNNWDEIEISRRNLAPKSELDRFRRTANNAAAIGPYARHGNQGWTPPKQPMRLDEASKLLLPIVANFLDQRGITFDISKKWADLIL